MTSVEHNIMICQWSEKSEIYFDNNDNFNNWSDKSWYFAIFDTDKSQNFAVIKFNNLFYCSIIKFVFSWISLGSEAMCPSHTRVIARRRKAWFYLCMSWILFAAQHSWMTLHMSRPLFVGSYFRSCGGISANEKEEQFASYDNKISLTSKQLTPSWFEWFLIGFTFSWCFHRYPYFDLDGWKRRSDLYKWP